MNTAGHIQSTVDDPNGYRQYVVNCLGENDSRKYFSISPFGIDFNAPEAVRSLVSGSTNRNQSYNLGVLNKIKIDDLNLGESAIFSTDATAGELKSFIKMRADGTIETNGTEDFMVGFTKLKEGFDKLADDLNSLINAYNVHVHITTATVGPTPTPGVIAPTTSTGTPTTASIDDSKKDNLKIE